MPQPEDPLARSTPSSPSSSRASVPPPFGLPGLRPGSIKTARMLAQVDHKGGDSRRDRRGRSELRRATKQGAAKQMPVIDLPWRSRTVTPPSMTKTAPVMNDAAGSTVERPIRHLLMAPSPAAGELLLLLLEDRVGDAVRIGPGQTRLTVALPRARRSGGARDAVLAAVALAKLAPRPSVEEMDDADASDFRRRRQRRRTVRVWAVSSTSIRWLSGRSHWRIDAVTSARPALLTMSRRRSAPRPRRSPADAPVGDVHRPAAAGAYDLLHHRVDGVWRSDRSPPRARLRRRRGAPWRDPCRWRPGQCGAARDQRRAW